MARPLPVLRRALRDSWRSFIGWTIGLAAVVFLYLPLFPSIAGEGQLTDIINGLPAELTNTLGFRDIASGPGYTHSTVYGLIGFVLVIIAAIGWGSTAIAGAEEGGRLELDLAHGVGRASYALQSALGILARLLLLGVVLALLVLAINRPAQLGLEPVNIIAATAALVGLGAVGAGTALAAGALTGRKSVATVTASTVVVGAYVLNAVANQVDNLEPLRALSPYAWAYQKEPLSQGADWVGLALLWGVAAALTVAAAVALRRRDITG